MRIGKGIVIACLFLVGVLSLGSLAYAAITREEAAVEVETFYVIDETHPDYEGLVSYWYEYSRDRGWEQTDLNVHFSDLDEVIDVIAMTGRTIDKFDPADMGFVSYWKGFRNGDLITMLETFTGETLDIHGDAQHYACVEYWLYIAIDGDFSPQGILAEYDQLLPIYEVALSAGNQALNRLVPGDIPSGANGFVEKVGPWIWFRNQIEIPKLNEFYRSNPGDTPLDINNPNDAGLINYWLQFAMTNYFSGPGYGDIDVNGFTGMFDALNGVIAPLTAYYEEFQTTPFDKSDPNHMGKASYWADFINDTTNIFDPYLTGTTAGEKLQSLFDAFNAVTPSVTAFYGIGALDKNNTTQMGKISYWAFYYLRPETYENGFDTGGADGDITVLEDWLTAMTNAIGPIEAFYGDELGTPPTLNLDNIDHSGLLAYWAKRMLNEMAGDPAQLSALFTKMDQVIPRVEGYYELAAGLIKKIPQTPQEETYWGLVGYWSDQIPAKFADVNALEDYLAAMDSAIPAIELFYGISNFDKLTQDYDQLGKLSYWTDYMIKDLSGDPTALYDYLENMKQVKDNTPKMREFYGKTSGFDIDSPMDMGLLSYWTADMISKSWTTADLNTFFDDMIYVKGVLALFIPIDIDNPKHMGLISYWTDFYRSLSTYGGPQGQADLEAAIQTEYNG